MEQLPDDEIIVALGANLQQPVAQVQRACAELQSLSGCELLAVSSLYGSTPQGPQQPDYVNAVAHIRSTQPPLALLDQLQTIEQAHQRIRQERWGPRTLDLDIVLYGRQVLQSERLIVPHERMHLRVFVLQPLAELYPQLQLPHLHVSVAEQLATLPPEGIWPLAETAR